MKALVQILCAVCMAVLVACTTHQEKDHEKERALLSASGNGDLEAVKRLIGEAADVNYKSENGRRFTPLLFAASQRQYQVSRFLVEHGADLNAGDIVGKTALFYALGESNEDADMVDFLLKKGASLTNFQNEVEFFGGRNPRLQQVLNTYNKSP